MPSLFRNKSRALLAEGTTGSGTQEPSFLPAMAPSPDREEDTIIGALSSVDALREVIVADMPLEEEPSGSLNIPTGPTKLPNRTQPQERAHHEGQAARSQPRARSERDGGEPSPEPAGAKVSESKQVPTAPPTSRRRKLLNTTHEQGGGGDGKVGREKSASRLSFRKRTGQSSQFAALVMPDDSILDYLVSTVARWLQKLRDTILRALSPKPLEQNAKKQGQVAGDACDILTSVESSSARRTTRQRTHRRGRPERL